MQQSERQSHSGPRTGMVLMMFASALFAGCSSFAPRPVAPISDITNAAESGQSAVQIMTAMKTARTTYALRGSDFPKLAEYGVPEQVLDELQQRFFGDVELFTRRWYQEGIAGGPASLYPQPVDLDNLERGGNGMAPTTNVGRVTHAGRPPGVPAWVPAIPAPPFNPKMSVDDVVNMTKQGDPTAQIIATLQKSHIHPMYADPGNVVSRTRTGAITGSLYVSLAEQGVAPEVLDALQVAYLSDHVERSRLRYWNTGGTYIP